jgi:predicted DNA-binding WGR domain protein
MTKKIKESKLNDVHVVSEAFLEDLAIDKISTDSFDLENLIKKHCICDWGSDVKARADMSVKSHEQKELENESKYSLKSSLGDGSGKIKMKLKDGAVVDPDSGLENEAHVLLENDSKDPYACVLGMVDISRGSNSYYKLQLIESDTFKKYYLFRSWGRVGTTIGGNKLEEYRSKKDAIEGFQGLYYEKTGNHWAYRKSAVKIANKFFPLEIDFGDVFFEFLSKLEIK